MGERMPDRTKLRVGDVIRILRVPEKDLEQREKELRENTVDEPGMTADAIEALIEQAPVVTITEIDEYGSPWFDCWIMDAQGRKNQHSIAIVEDESWEIVSRARP